MDDSREDDYTQTHTFRRISGAPLEKMRNLPPGMGTSQDIIFREDEKEYLQFEEGGTFSKADLRA